MSDLKYICPVTKKRGWKSPKTAKKGRTSIRNSTKLRVYRCEFCEYYHLTKCENDKTRRKRKIQAYLNTRRERLENRHERSRYDRQYE